jgi:hypothetical protein
MPCHLELQQLLSAEPYKVLDAFGQALVYVNARETRAEAYLAKALTFDEARRIAVNPAS